MRERVARLEQAITEAVKLASPALQQVTNDLRELRGIADISAVTIVAELGQVSRFDSARQLMGYCAQCPAKTPVASEPDEEASLRLATRNCDASLLKPHGAIVVHQVSGTDCADDRRPFQKRPRRLRGRRNIGCISGI